MKKTRQHELPTVCPCGGKRLLNADLYCGDYHTHPAPADHWEVLRHCVACGALLLRGPKRVVIVGYNLRIPPRDHWEEASQPGGSNGNKLSPGTGRETT